MQRRPLLYLDMQNARIKPARQKRSLRLKERTVYPISGGYIPRRNNEKFRDHAAFFRYLSRLPAPSHKIRGLGEMLRIGNGEQISEKQLKLWHPQNVDYVGDLS